MISGVWRHVLSCALYGGVLVFLLFFCADRRDYISGSTALRMENMEIWRSHFSPLDLISNEFVFFFWYNQFMYTDGRKGKRCQNAAIE